MPLALPGLAIPLLVLAGALVALGIVATLHHATRAIFGPILGWVEKWTLLGMVLGTPANWVAHWLDKEFGAAEKALDGAITFWFHQLAFAGEWWWSEIRDVAHSVYTLSTAVLGRDFLKLYHAAVKALDAAIGAVDHFAHDVWHVATWAKWEINHVAHGVIGVAVRDILRPFTIELRTWERAVNTWERWAQREITVTLPRAVDRLGVRVRDLTDFYTRLLGRVKRLEGLFAAGAFAALVATALTRLGLDWIKCGNAKALGKGVCGLPTAFLEDLLALLVDFAVLESICDLIPILNAAARDVGVPLVNGIAGVVGAGSCGGLGDPPGLPAPDWQPPPYEGIGFA